MELLNDVSTIESDDNDVSDNGDTADVEISPFKGSPISASCQTVLKGAKGQLIKCRESSKKLTKEEENAANMEKFFKNVGEKAQSILSFFVLSPY